MKSWVVEVRMSSPEGTAETRLFGIRARLCRLLKNSCFVSGHDLKSGRKGLKKRWALAPATTRVTKMDLFRSRFNQMSII
jgi:hypothetical protein